LHIAPFMPPVPCGEGKKSSTQVSSGQNLVSEPVHDKLASWSVLSSSGARWASLTADIYDFRTSDTPELRSADPGIALHLSSPTLIDLTLDGYRDTRVRVEGDLSVFSAGSRRQMQSKRPHKVLVITLHREVVLRAIYEMKAAHAFELGGLPFLRDAQIEHICHAVLAEMDCDYASGPLYGDSLSLALCSRLLSRVSSFDPDSGRRGGIAPHTLHRVMEYIESNLTATLRMEELAEIASLSEYRFAHNFKTATGISPHQYVINQRIERAKRILRETDLSVIETAYSVGCQSLSRFNSLFRRQIGATPSAYRSSFR
jgi:AraC family transcriptional regulator